MRYVTYSRTESGIVERTHNRMTTEQVTATITGRFSHLNDTDAGRQACEEYEAAIDAGFTQAQAEVLASNVLQRAGYNVNAEGGADFASAEYLAAAAKRSVVEFNGVEYALIDDAQVGNYGTDGGVAYFAAAVDRTGSRHRVMWETTAEWDTRTEEEHAERAGDQSDACDWDAPVAVSPA